MRSFWPACHNRKRPGNTPPDRHASAASFPLSAHVTDEALFLRRVVPRQRDGAVIVAGRTPLLHFLPALPPGERLQKGAVLFVRGHLFRLSPAGAHQEKSENDADNGDEYQVSFIHLHPVLLLRD